MGLLGVIDSVLGSDFSGNKAKSSIDKAVGQANAANQAAMDIITQYGNQAMDIYKEYLNKGLDESTAMQNAAIDVLKQTGATSEKTFTDWYNKSQAAAQPFTDATKGMLTSVPALQAALGLPSDTTYNVEASPLYQWQMQQMDEQMAHQLNAMGLNDSNVAAFLRSKNVGQLGAEERERQVSNLMNMAGMGLQAGQSLGQNEMAAGQTLSGIQSNTGANIANVYNNAAANRGAAYQNAGSALGQTMLGIGGNLAQGQIGIGQNLMNAGISKAQVPNGMNQLINTGLQLYGMGAFNRPAATPVQSTGSVGGFSFNNTPQLYGLKY